RAAARGQSGIPGSAGMKQGRGRSGAMNAARVAIAWTGVLAVSALAEPAPGAQNQSAASLDWKPRSALSPEALARLPGYCEGAYVQPAYGRDGQLPRAEPDEGSESGHALPIHLSAGR